MDDEDATFKSRLSPEDRRRRDRRIPRRANLSYYEDSPFKNIFDSGDDQALLNLTGLDHHTFSKLLGIYQPHYSSFTWCRLFKSVRRLKICSRRRRMLDATGSLGLVLTWFRTKGSCTRNLQLIFGLTGTPMYTWLKFGRRVLLFALQKVDSAKISAPSVQELHIYMSAVAAKYPRMNVVWGAMDGLKLTFQKANNGIKQNHFYNGWTHGHYISCIFVFAPDGRIRVCIINCPGSMHDSTMAQYGVYHKLEQLYKDHGATVVVDSAFSRGAYPFLIKSSQEDPAGEPEAVLAHRDATSIRQLSEWGMRMIQAQFPRVTEPIQYEVKGERRIILHLMVLLYNFQTAEIGINQILNSFMHDKNNYYGRDEMPGPVANLHDYL